MSVHNDPYSDLFKAGRHVGGASEEVTSQQIMIHVVTCWSVSQSGSKHSKSSSRCEKKKLFAKVLPWPEEHAFFCFICTTVAAALHTVHAGFNNWSLRTLPRSYALSSCRSLLPPPLSPCFICLLWGPKSCLRVLISQGGLSPPYHSPRSVLVCLCLHCICSRVGLFAECPPYHRGLVC